MKKAIGIDIGGTKIAAGIISEYGELLYRMEVKSNTSDREKMFDGVVEALERVLAESTLSLADIDGIGVGVPGKVDRENGIAVFQNNLPWQQFPIVSRLQSRFRFERVIVDNDVYMAAFAEWKAAHVQMFETFIYMTISTGISCAIIHNGTFIRGAGFAGEIGLLPVYSMHVDKRNARLEAVASGPAIHDLADKKLRLEHLSTKDVFAEYTKGKSEYQSIIDELADSLAQGLYAVSCIVDPHKVVIGGSVMVNNPFLLELIREKLKIYQIPEQHHILAKMSVSALKQDNGVVGAGLRVFDRM